MTKLTKWIDVITLFDSRAAYMLNSQSCCIIISRRMYLQYGREIFLQQHAFFYVYMLVAPFDKTERFDVFTTNKQAILL